MNQETLKLHFVLPGNDLTFAGEASGSVKKMLNQLGVAPATVRRVAVAMYETEINAVIHANGGEADVEISKDEIVVRIADKGPGIPDVDLAMQAGYSTAPDSIREMGFGAGMGLPNIKKNADRLEIITGVGKGTTVIISVFI